jgi:ParB-like chromosome segregation protein Spo0J
MLIESVPIGSLLPDPSNVRRHDDKNLAAIKASLKRFGQRKPIVTRNGIVIAGNGTLAAAQALGWSEIQVVRADDMTATDAAAFGIADNRTTDLSTFDMDALGSTLQALREDGMDLAEIGFDVGDLEFTPTLPDDDDSPPVEKFQLVVTFENDAAQQDLFLELRDRGFKVKA